MYFQKLSHNIFEPTAECPPWKYVQQVYIIFTFPAITVSGKGFDAFCQKKHVKSWEKKVPFCLISNSEIVRKKLRSMIGGWRTYVSSMHKNTAVINLGNDSASCLQTQQGRWRNEIWNLNTNTAYDWRRDSDAWSQIQREYSWKYFGSLDTNTAGKFWSIFWSLDTNTAGKLGKIRQVALARGLDSGFTLCCLRFFALHRQIGTHAYIQKYRYMEICTLANTQTHTHK